ncbi:clathrin interactor EPSIN 2-like isoform X4 [Gossypium australe]|uniref:Clathrin interactor EPSIN 2-like isoform X4 n=1 Tax=Gossypium australe TaxID=47621 RepID=A0A5B6WGK6_9ROSI|nr:clathrin interactor EPSIN 2-like isoform X4 [Gossypium australe]
MKKALGQTVRDLKRGVNKKVLKVPGIEQKRSRIISGIQLYFFGEVVEVRRVNAHVYIMVLDATSNEPWGPHGSLLADIAMATRNYHEYQIIMAVIWKRISDTGKNWRHVYKGLTVLEYLVAHGSERVIDDIREHAYQISVIASLSDFQYIDSSGRDQGSNIRKKSQSLVVLVNDKERIIEVRQKAAANKDKFRSTSTGGMNRAGSGGQWDRYDYDYQYGYRDDDQYGRYSDSNSRDGDRYSRDNEDRYGRDGYKDDDYKGRSTSVDGDQHGTRSRSSDRDRAFDDDGDSSRGSNARADDYSQDGRRHEQKFSEQKNDAPSSYEAVNESHSPVHSERDGETSVAAAPRSSSPPASNNPNLATSDFGNLASPSNKNVEAFNAFDPRVSVSAASAGAPVSTPGPAPPTASTSSEIDLLGALSDSWAVVPTLSETPAAEADAHAKGSIPSFAANPSASNSGNQGFDDPFGDGPFKAFPSGDAASAQRQISTPATTFQATMSQNMEAARPPSVKSEIVTGFDFGESFSASAYSTLNASNSQPPSGNSQFLTQELSDPNQEDDILAEILPPSGPANDVASHTVFSAPSSQSALPVATYGQHAQSGANMYQPAQPSSNPYGQPAQPSANPYAQNGQPSANPYGHPAQPSANPYGQNGQPSANPYGQPAQPSANPYGQNGQPSANPYGQPAQPSANPYGQNGHSSANPYGQPVQPSANPYSQNGQPSANPYGLPPPPSANPYGQSSANPYGQPTQPNAIPYGQSAQPNANPYGQPAQPNANPYGQPAQPNANPYSQPVQVHANPYGQPAQPNANPYNQPAQPNANPYGQPTQPNANPYGQPVQPSANPYAQPTQSVSAAPQIPGSTAQSSSGSLMIGSNGPVSSQMAAQPPSPAAPAIQFNTGNFISQQGSAVPVESQSAQTTNDSGAHNNSDVLGGFFSQPGPNASVAPQTAPPSSTGALAIVLQPSKDKFEPKSAVWADTLSRGLVNLNISGPKTNPLSDIGVDFDAINRKEKRLEKPAPTAVTSTVTMGKAMGSGSGIGRAGASVLRAPANPMVGSGMGMGMGGGPVGGVGMGGYGGMNQQPMGMGMGMNMGMNPGMGMNNMGMNPGMGMSNMGMNPGMGMSNMGMNPGMGMSNMGMNQGMGMNMGMNPGMGMNNMGMNRGMEMNNMGMSAGMGMNMGMGQATHMQSQSGMPGGYNPMMGFNGYSQQPHGGGGGYR